MDLRNVRNRGDAAIHSADRLSSLPDELLIQILSLLPTKDAAVTCVLSNKCRRIFHCLTTLEFDASPISHCRVSPYQTDRFLGFKRFVDNVLEEHQSRYLTKFILRLGLGFNQWFRRLHSDKSIIPRQRGCQTNKGCLPRVKYTLANAWINFPLTCSGLKELDLCVYIRHHPSRVQLPGDIFVSHTLETLKLDVNIGLDQACNMPSYRLPNLKLLQLRATFIPEDDFVGRLVSSCPVLEDLTVEAIWNQPHFTSISSTSLRRLSLLILKLDKHRNTESVIIHTPNLEYLLYGDNLSVNYSVTTMPNLVKAIIYILNEVPSKTMEISFQQMLNLTRPLHNVEHLLLDLACTKCLHFAGVENQLPVFLNLKHLELGVSWRTFWDIAPLAMLNCSPILETLVFAQGFMFAGNLIVDSAELRAEQEFCRTTQPIPSCCRSHFKKIVINCYYGNEREENIVGFLLRHALILEELVAYTSQPVEDNMAMECRLKNLPRASRSCSIQVLQNS